MLEVIIWSAVFLISFLILTKSSQYFISSIKDLSASLKVSPFVIGATIVTISTSLPELTSSIFSIFKNSSEIVIGNVTGANIANIFLVLGISALFAKDSIKIKENSSQIGLFMLVISSILLTITIIDGIFTIYESLLFVALLIAYLFITHELNNTSRNKKQEIKLNYKSIIITIASLIFIYISAKYAVESIINLSRLLGIGKAIIASTIVSIGTTLPELMVSISAIRENEIGIAIGNVLGSNVFNILGVMGLTGFFGNIIIPNQIISFTLPVMLLSTLVFFVIFLDNKLTKPEALILILIYLSFLFYSFIAI